jgi:acetyl-CoA carboxylase alpha subunit
VSDQIAKGLTELESMSGEQLVKSRREKYLAMGRTL